MTQPSNLTVLIAMQTLGSKVTEQRSHLAGGAVATGRVFQKIWTSKFLI